MNTKPILKTAFALVVALVFCAVHSSAGFQDTKPFIGNWTGNISVMGQELEIILDFALDDSQQITGTIDVPAQGATDIPLGEITIEGKKISFVIAGVPGDPIFKGELDETGKKMRGSFAQGGAEGTFSVDKQS